MAHIWKNTQFTQIEKPGFDHVVTDGQNKQTQEKHNLRLELGK